jgi:ribonuclease HI
MKYSAEDDARVYHASPGNLSKPTDGPTASSKRSSKPVSQQSLGFNDLVWQNPAGEREMSHELPESLVSLPAPDDGAIEFFTDGACSGNPGPCGYGLTLRDGDEYCEVSQFLGRGTNNIAELYAILVAMEMSGERAKPAVIHTDSQFSIDMLTKNWKAKKNRELIAACRDAYRDLDITFVKVKGHAGIPLNERADDLAVAAVDRAG